eukprot:TRINITY_DN8296_c1_g3_i2.p1 TRINITY_DN8296_c1_g3~~TRINITY_DN8296_c1_g3_i2.p1  ORF type:complete len:333 (+),score=19.47 TRINITY_DN8296_c1_g3_i2:72-1001(+)
MMAQGNFKVDRDAISYGFYPGTLFSNRMERPPSELWLEPSEGYQMSSCTVSPTAESGIPMPRFLGRMQQQSEHEVQGDNYSRTNFHAWATNYTHECREIRAGRADMWFPTEKDCGCDQVLAAAAAGLRDATSSWFQGIVTESRNGHRHLAPRGLSLMQLLENSYTTSERYKSSFYQRSGYPRSSKSAGCRKERLSKCDEEVPLTRGRSQDSRYESRVSQKDQASSTNVSSSYPSQVNEEPVSGSLVSAGAVWHAGGRCVPCKFFRSKVGCKSGLNCEFCHYPHKELSRSQLRVRFKRSLQDKGTDLSWR